MAGEKPGHEKNRPTQQTCLNACSKIGLSLGEIARHVLHEERFGGLVAETVGLAVDHRVH